MALSQQFAVSEIMERLGETPGLLAVNGPPGTGKTTMLRDLIAAIVVARAERLAQLPSPAAAFDESRSYRWLQGEWPRTITPLKPQLTGMEIVVASSNNGAVENVTTEIPGAQGIGKQWLAAAERVDYFASTARLVHGEGAWAMAAARLGNATNRRTFADSFWWGTPNRKDSRKDGCMVDLLDRLGQQPQNWRAARKSFLAAREKVRILSAERMEVAAALTRVPVLRQDAARASTAVAAADAALGSLQESLREAKSGLSVAAQRHQQATRLWDDHLRAKPGFLVSLSTGFRAGRKWYARQQDLESALEDTRQSLSAAQLAIPAAWDKIAAANRSRSEAIGRLNRLTTELKTAQETISRGRQDWGNHVPEFPAEPADSAPDDSEVAASRERTAVWADEEFAAARTEMFLAALALHKAFISAEAARIKPNLAALMDVLKGKGRPPDRAVLAAWQTLFLVVPVVSTTFASVPAMFAGLGRESLGWLLIDEAGQASPQQAAGAIWRAKRTVVVGDPLQIKPVVTLPWGGQQALLQVLGVDQEWAPEFTSVQRVADRLAIYGTWLPGSARDDSGRVWVGMPLRVHRRCDHPMFDVSNEIAYDGLMVYGTSDREPFPGRNIWYDIRSRDARGHWIPAEGERLRWLLGQLRDSGTEVRQIRVISPFRQVADEAKSVHREVFGEACSAEDRKKWVGTVHIMQGKEADVVVLILGGNPGKPGARTFATQAPNLVNVAVTRARRRLYVIGDRSTWGTARYFNVLAQYMQTWPSSDRSVAADEPPTLVEGGRANL